MEVRGINAIHLTKVEPKVVKQAVVQQQGGRPLEQQVTKQELRQQIERLNEVIKPIYTSAQFEFHEKLGKYYVKVVNTETKEVIREIPDRKFLDMYASMMELMGVFVDEKL